ncbi:MAG: TonB-dependent receptor [Pseudomonadota bacterium]
MEIKQNLKATLVAAASAASSIALATAAAAQDVDPAAITDEIVVRGVNIPDEKRATSEISAVLDEAAFQRQGDSDIASALRRVTGLTINDGKFVIVRGLNERYSNATVNGSPLPSPEPLRRIVPLDLIPTSVLSGTLVQKTYSPNYSAEFGGGVIELRTTKLPEQSFFEISVSGELDTESTFRDGLLYEGGSRDWLGFDDGTRNTPEVNGASIFNVLGNPAVDQATQDAADLAVENQDTVLITENALGPNWSVGLSGGQRFDLDNDISIGYVAAVSLSNTFQIRNGFRQRGIVAVQDGALVEDQNFFRSGDFRNTTHDAALNGLFSAGVEIGPDHEIAFTGLMLRSTTKEARTFEGIRETFETGLRFREDNTEFFERQVWQGQLTGEHFFPSLADLSLNWRAAYGEAFRDSPYERTFNFSFNEQTGQPFLQLGSGNFDQPIRFSKVEDENLDAGIDLKLPVNFSDNATDIIFGYAYTDKARESLVRLIGLDQDAIILNGTGLEFSRPDIVLSPAVVGTTLLDYNFQFAGVENPNDFAGDLEVHAAYVGIDTELGPYFRLAAGGRFEDSTQQVATSRPTLGGLPDVQVFDPLDEEYFLPAVTLTWNPLADIQVRAGFSQTIVRPQFRELSPSFFINVDTDFDFAGNPFLVNTEITNYDVRAEWYFSRGQFATIGFFYKDLTNPIEEFDTALGGDRVRTSFYNAPSAELWGMELEFEKNFDLDLMGDDSWLGRWGRGKELVFKTNYTWSDSSVSADGTVIRSAPSAQLNDILPLIDDAANVLVDGRRLQGQSVHIFNAQIGWRDFDRNSEGTFLINYASDRTRTVERIVGPGDLIPAIVEDVPLTIDFVYNRELELNGAPYQLNFKVGNILGQGYNARRLDPDAPDGVLEITDLYDLGVTVSAGLTRRF